VVADVLSRMSYVNVTMVSLMPRELYKEFEQLNLGFIAHMEVDKGDDRSTQGT
jgi:hypothetical protein